MSEKKLKEFTAGFPSGIGTFTRPDSSGIRGGFDGKIRKDTGRGDVYPYDRDDRYGDPAPYDRGSKGGTSHQGITPKNTEHSVWDEIEEAMGTPIFFKKAVQGAQMGHATGVPGATGDWASNPIKPWDDDMEDDIDEVALQRMTINPSVPPPEPIPNMGVPNSHDQTDDEIEKKIDRIWGREDNPSTTAPGGEVDGVSMEPSTIYVLGTNRPFGQGMGHSLRPSRGPARFGLIPKESVWVGLSKMLGRSKK
jgi:hypothetical protein